MRPADLLSPHVIKATPELRDPSGSDPAWRVSPGHIRDVVIASDAILVFAASVIAKYLYIDVLLGSGIASDYMGVGLLASLICYWWLKEQRQRGGEFETLPPTKVLRGLLVSFGLLIVLGAALKLTNSFSRGWLATWFVLSFGLIVAKDRLGLFTLGLLAQRGQVRRNIAIYGAGAHGRALKAELEEQATTPLVVDLYDARKPEDLAAGETATMRGDMRTLIQDGLNNRYERIIVCLPTERVSEVQPLIENVGFLPVAVQVCPDNLQWAGRDPHIVASHGRYFIDVSDSPLHQWGGIGKRGMDLVLGSLLTVLALPLMALAALALKIENRGPVLSRYRRHGYNHQTIEVLCFRTEPAGEPDGERLSDTRPECPEATRVGRALIAWRLHQLPRLFNVLTGQMSLVGPRPHALAHNHYCNEVVARYANRHKVKPGLIGWSQVHGFGESTDQAIETMADQAAVDIHYIENWSISLDLKILLVAPFLMVFRDASSAPVRAASRLLGIGRADFGPTRAVVDRGIARAFSETAEIAHHEFLVEGLKVSTLSVVEAARRIAEGCRSQARSQSVFTINLDHVVKLRADKTFRDAYKRASLILADGFPIVWAGRLLGRKLDRAAGSDLIQPLCAEAEARGLRIFLLGSTFDVLTGAARQLKGRHPGLDISGVYAPSRNFDPSSDEAKSCFDMLEAARADICLVALGAPKQEVLAARACEQTRGITFVCIGGGLDFIVGAQVRAPRLVQAMALEWMWRLLGNPRRLAARYLYCLRVVPSFFVRTLGGRHHETG